MRYLITGGLGFIGANLAAEALRRQDELMVFDNQSRVGAARNLEWLRDVGSFAYQQADIRDSEAVDRAVADFEPDALFHLAGQVAMTTSMEQPRLDFETNVVGTINVLEAVRTKMPAAQILYSSTNKVYGDLEWLTYEEGETRYVVTDRPNGLDEHTPLDFRSPYGCSKGAADQYILEYARLFDMQTTVFRHSSMYGSRQFSTVDQGWLGWFCQQALLTKQGRLTQPFTISGNGKQVRDVLEVRDVVRLYFATVERREAAAGEVFNIGGGMENSLSLLELFALLEETLETSLQWDSLPPRYSDQKVFVADNRKAERLLGWRPRQTAADGIVEMLDWLQLPSSGL